MEWLADRQAELLPVPPAKAGVLLGHKKLDTTALYTRVAISALGQVTSPLDFLFKDARLTRRRCHCRRSRWRTFSAAADRLGVCLMPAM